ncbi:Uncharacterized protein TCAP_07078 [Tolypocladium capitatum]|uniref:Uncharacterized protein n=1 Tax=Tolypocladium capitatum TaxID=45235 RepID=A0A2K3Q5A7_9HYPO|nr:Uncharacterized protein TCAP_07078 [Tolypocladium capitatum]
MPFVGGRGDDGVHPGRKRRWEDDEGAVYRLYSPEKQADFYVLNQPQELPPRKILPLSKRARITDDEVDFHSGLAPTHRRRPSQQKALQDQPGLGNRVPARLSGALLTPCHICHRKPTKKSDLDSFAECQGCGERTCFVCIRECQGWNADEGEEALSRSFHMDDVDDMPQDQPQPPAQHDDRREVQHGDKVQKDGKGWDACGHRAVVCSRCCIEKGRQGEVVCLGCLSGMPGA